MYKQKDWKVNPINSPLPDGINPGGGAKFGRTQGPIRDHWKGKLVPKGSGLTPEHLSKMQIGIGFLNEKEKRVFIDILFEYELSTTPRWAASIPKSNHLL